MAHDIDAAKFPNRGPIPCKLFGVVPYIRSCSLLRAMVHTLFLFMREPSFLEAYAVLVITGST